MADLIKVRFKRDAIVERAPLDPARGGFRREIISAGTIQRITHASLQFWRDRGDYVEIMRDERPVPASGPVILSPFAHPEVTKAGVRRTIEQVRTALQAQDQAGAAGALGAMLCEAALELVPDLLSDTRMILEAARDDLSAGGGLAVNTQELEEALAEFDNMLLPPSRRRKT